MQTKGEPTSTEQRVEEIARKLSPADRRNMVRTPHPQPLPGRWLFAGSVAEAWRLAELGLLDRTGFTPDGLAVRAHLKDKHHEPDRTRLARKTGALASEPRARTSAVHDLRTFAARG